MSLMCAAMTQDQIILFALLGCIFGLLIWGRFRYDLIAFSALAVALVAGVVPKDAAFSGFGHPATVIIALVLIVSRGLFASGAIELITRHLISSGRSLAAHIGIMSALSAGFFGVSATRYSAMSGQVSEVLRPMSVCSAFLNLHSCLFWKSTA